MNRRSLISAALAGVAVFVTATASVAADWPKRPINLVVPYKAGGGTDAYARAISAAAADVLDVPVVVVNKPGSGGLNGANSVVGARPDGYTMMMTSGGSFLLSTMTRDTKIDALESFEFVAQVGKLQTSLMVPKDSPFQTVQDVIDAAQANPGSLRWAHSGRGGFHFVGGLGFLANNHIEAQDVPFKGGGPTRAALIGSQADFGFLGVQQLAGFEDNLRALAVNSAERDSIMTEVPAFGELGIPFAAVSSPVIVFAPKGTPAEVITAMEAALAEIAAKPEFAELLAKRGTGPVYANGADAKAGLTAMKADAAPLVAGLTK
ncbi:tripartite tricarboxylate transporter substrate binding protein [Phaeobacter gallaeciensis]|uniref:Tripartite tricarboxylate transporter substrate binding protein n=2 Tax=Roseobacteraceae TaxID=2854170 RepID=A0A366WUD0_9RHOB|nr:MULTISPECIES: tripartite tricarboxylate transporter substrate binding protein [Roseobacteraceae]MBT3143825.1 tripartite tricarboxylate transporter substrate binding protein [Falsiruegeria litorea]MBT8169510.1 tripartite tricarboxylate transporter substrate binding protein [Falsiruegeria litorea]RBW53585.1 tripartite tricarboxylate transporter substrate binding protein [Phaeobacter gallaeciensis]